MQGKGRGKRKEERKWEGEGEVPLGMPSYKGPHIAKVLTELSRLLGIN